MKKLLLIALLIFVLSNPVLGSVDYEGLVRDEVPKKPFIIQHFLGFVSYLQSNLFPQEYVDVYIKFEDPEDVDSFLDSVGVMSFEDKEEFKKSMNLVMQDYVSIDVNHSYSHAISGRVSKSEIGYLESFSFVKGVFENHEVEIFLEDSVPLINANQIHNIEINNENVNGSDFSVCVLDTGVDKTHPDLEGRVIAEKCFCTDCCSDGENVGDEAVDDHGHGTHVSGIISSSSGLTGTAPGANIVAVKVLSSLGSGNTANLDQAISWCKNNAEAYNITAISMSLGVNCEKNPEYCSSTYCKHATEDNINLATEKNISVVASTGNDGETDLVSSPACVENVIRAISTTKSDVISSFSNRGSNFDILAAPGSQIKSLKAEGTSISGCSDQGVYRICSGTSMAAPHVSGAIALLNHANSLRGNDPYTRDELFSILNNTGVEIDDTSGSGVNYFRINTLSAVNFEYLITSLNINTSHLNKGEEVNVSWDIQNKSELSNITLNVSHSTYSLVSNELGNTYKLFNDSQITKGGIQYVTLYVEDVENRSVFAYGSFNSSLRSPSVNFTINNESNNFLINESSNLEIKVNVLESESNVTLYINNNFVVNNETILTNYEFDNVLLYNITITMNESESYLPYQETIFVHHVNSSPTLTSVIPEDYNITVNRSVDELFEVNTSDFINVSYKWVLNELNVSKNNSYYFNTTGLELGSYNLTLNISNSFYWDLINWNITLKGLRPIINNTQPSLNFSEKKKNSFNITFSHDSFDLGNLDLNTVWFVNGENLGDTWNFSVDTNDYDEGVYNISLLVNNTDDFNKSYTWNLTILPENNPVYFNKTISDFEWEQGSNLNNIINLSEYVVNVDDDVLTYTWSSTNVNLVINDGIASFQPNSNFHGVETVSINVSDGYSWNKSNNFTLTINEKVTSSPSRPSSSGVVKTVDEIINESDEEKNYFEKSFLIVEDNIEIKNNGSLSRIIISVSDSYSNALVRITEFEEDSDQVPFKMDSTTYKYFRIEYSTIRSESITNATFQFNVQKEWLQNQNINPEEISLYRHNNGWNEIETQLESETINTYTYKATSPGLSYFAIGKKVVEEIRVEETREIEIDDLIQQPTIRYENFNYVIVSIASLLIAFLLILLFEKRAVKKTENHKQELITSQIKKVKNLIKEGKKEDAKKIIRKIKEN